MNEQLKHAFEAAQQLPDQAQAAIAARILEEIEEQEWEAIVSQPHVRQRLRELGRQALEEDSAGETEEGGFDCQ
jgi:hypothetical protein